jgi:hypothetical protein
MTSKIYRVDNAGGSQWPGQRVTDGAAWGKLPDPTADYQAMLDQGLRLNRAFVSINDSLVREAIVNLVVEAAKNESGEDVPPPDRTPRQAVDFAAGGTNATAASDVSRRNVKVS